MEGLKRQPRYAYENGLGDLRLVIKFGSTGLPVLQEYDQTDQTWSDAPNDGGSPATYGPVENAYVQRSAAGTFLVTFGTQGGVPRFDGVSGCFESSTGIPNAPDIGVKASSVPVPNANSFTFVTSTGGVATDPTSGTVLKLFVKFQGY